MRQENIYEVLNEVAKRKGISVEQVIADIDLAIEETIRTLRQQNDRATLRKWEKIPCAGEIPNAVELMSYLGDIVLKRI